MCRGPRPERYFFVVVGKDGTAPGGELSLSTGIVTLLVMSPGEGMFWGGKIGGAIGGSGGNGGSPGVGRFFGIEPVGRTAKT